MSAFRFCTRQGFEAYLRKCIRAVDEEPPRTLCGELTTGDDATAFTADNVETMACKGCVIVWSQLMARWSWEDTQERERKK